nr:hypothetical protein [Raphanus sativus cryptic virus 2]
MASELKTTASESTVDKGEAPAPSSSSVKSPIKPVSSGVGRAKTETPHLPASNYEIPRYTRDTQPVVGNKNYEFSLRMDGRLGFAMDRSRTAFPEVNCSLNRNHFHDGIRKVLVQILSEMARLKQDLSDADIVDRVNSVALILAYGVGTMAYLKLRAINLLRPNEASKFLTKPKVPDHFEIPTPFAFAISQLGVVEVSSLSRRMICYPTADLADASSHLCENKRFWSQTAYAEAVRYAKYLGMSFSTVDLDIKVGSSWWLFKPDLTDGLLSLRCPLPEDNYTLAGATVYMLFYHDVGSDPAIDLFDVTALGTNDYGSFIRNPRDGFNATAYYAISSEGSDEMWKSSA